MSDQSVESDRASEDQASEDQGSERPGDLGAAPENPDPPAGGWDDYDFTPPLDFAGDPTEEPT